MAPRACPPTRIRLEPKETIFCLHHFRQIANYIEKGLVAKCTGSGTEDNAHPSTSPPKRIQPRRAAKHAQVNQESASSSTTPANSGWIIRTVSLGELAFAKPIHLPESLQREIEAKIKRLRSEHARRLRADKTCCTFGPKAWICEACVFRTENKNSVRMVNAASRALKDYYAPEANMGFTEEDVCLALRMGDIEKWRTVRVAESRVVEVGGLRFAMDVCDGTPKVMFLSGVE